MRLRTLQPATDAAPLADWLRDYLQRHRDWWAAAYGSPPQRDLDDLVAGEWDDLVEDAARPDHFVRLLAPDPAPGAPQGEPLGVVHARLQACHFTALPLGVLAWIYVTPAARGAGAGDRLMTAAHAWMAARGVRGRQVYVTAANAAAVRLYERHGYRVADHRMLGGPPAVE